jgi:amino acid adenylation domain-containing protein
MERGHTLQGVVSDDPAVKRWVGAQTDARLWSSSDKEAGLRQNEFDYLFSIVNEHILSTEILALPRQLPINYHDSLLPEFAGRNATAWAIYNKKQTHGITWHVMVSAVDAGDILVQQDVRVAPHDTTFILNAKCFDAAIKGFDKLLTQIELGRICRKPQNAAHRTQFFSTQRLPNAGLIDWSMSADDIAAMVRAADCGPHPCEIGLAKSRIAGEWVIIKAVHPTRKQSIFSPGTILEVRDTHTTVATGTDDLIITNLLFLDGSPVGLAKEGYLLGIDDGARFETFGPDKLEELSSLVQKASTHECWWARRLAELRMVGFRELSTGLSGAHSLEKTACETFDVPEDITSLWKKEVWPHSWAAFCANVFAAYLARASGTFDFDYGVVLPGSVSRDVGIAGMFSEVLPIHVSLDSDTTGTGLAKSLENELANIQSRGRFLRDIHARHPALVEATFPFVLDFGSLPGNLLQPGGEIVVALTDDIFKIRWTYRPSLFTRDDIDRFMKQFLQIARSLLRRPDDAIATYDILSEEERLLQTVRPSPTESKTDRETVSEMFDRVAARFPDQIAVRHDQLFITYARLAELSSALASQLMMRGVGPKDIVALLADRNIAWIIGILGILKAGAAYLPLDASEPNSRLNQAITDSGARFALCNNGERRSYMPVSVEMLFMDSLTEIGSDNAVSGIEKITTKRVNTPDDPAYVIYTSGSSGSPKGTVISHRALSYFIDQDNQTYSISIHDRVLQVCAISFDAAVEEIFSALTTGATLVLRTKDMAKSLVQFFARCKEWKVTVIGLFPSQFQDAVDAMETHGFPETIRLVTTGGEAVQVADVLRWQSFFAGRALPAPRLVNVYGLTEATVASVVCDLTNREFASHRVSIGRPLSGTTVRILDRNKRPVPICVPGEIHISGPGLADGYLNRPELTRERFLSDPFAPNNRMLATGDKGRFLPDGCIEFLGRLDQQIKVSGIRIELGEIEAVVRSHPLVKKVAVTKSSHSGDERLVAYIVLEASEVENVLPEIDIAINPVPMDISATLREYLSERLPAIMIPHLYCAVSDLPLDRHGKVDKNKLPAPDWSGRLAAEKLQGGAESLLIELFQKALRIASIGIRDNYFDLGGDSLAALNLLLSIETSFGIRLSLEQLFRSPTIKELAELISGQKDKDESGASGSRHILNSMPGSGEPELPDEAIDIVTFRHEGSRRPILLLHTADGLLGGYYQLINALGTDQPVYGAESPALYRPEDFPSSLEEAATRILRQIPKLELNATPAFIGYSWGGLLAFEVSRLWALRYGETPFVGLIGTAAPLPRVTLRQRVGHFFRWLPHWLWYGRASWRTRLRRLPQFFWLLHLNFVRQIKPELPDWAEDRTTKEYLALGINYKPSVGQLIPIDLFRLLSDHRPSGAHPLWWWEFDYLRDGGWSRWAGALPKIHWCEGDHATVLRPPLVGRLARQIRAAIDAHDGAPN